MFFASRRVDFHFKEMGVAYIRVKHVFLFLPVPGTGKCPSMMPVLFNDVWLPCLQVIVGSMYPVCDSHLERHILCNCRHQGGMCGLYPCQSQSERHGLFLSMPLKRASVELVCFTAFLKGRAFCNSQSHVMCHDLCFQLCFSVSVSAKQSSQAQLRRRVLCICQSQVMGGPIASVNLW